MLIIQFLTQPTQTHQYSQILLTRKVKVTTGHKGVHLFISPDLSCILEAEKVHHQYVYVYVFAYSVYCMIWLIYIRAH